MLSRSTKIFNSLISKNPSSAFKAIGHCKSDKNKVINTLYLGNKLYKVQCVKDEFFDSLSSLKCPPPSPKFGHSDLDYKIILWLSANDAGTSSYLLKSPRKSYTL